MINIYLNGGLGNQLFQIFATISHAIRMNEPFSLSVYNNSPNRSTYWLTFLKNLKKYTTNNPLYSNIYNEPFFHYQQIPHIKNTLLKGYFQSAKYFEKKYKQISNLIGIKEQQSIVKAKYPLYFKDQNIGMHFRYGDYKKLTHVYHLLDIDYYRKAIKYIIDKKENINSIVYFYEQQDETLIKEIVNKLTLNFPKLQFVGIDTNIPDYEQLIIMSCCSHNIIANSSFSWWGAYFNANKEKIVCCPPLWFKKNNLITKDLNVKGWITIV